MGLTIHYTIRAKKRWTYETIRDRLERVRERVCREFPSLAYASPLSELTKENSGLCDEFNPDGLSVDSRWIESPWFPGRSWAQDAEKSLVACFDPGEGSVSIFIGLSWFDSWKTDRQRLSAGGRIMMPCWDQGKNADWYPRSSAILSEYKDKYRLVPSSMEVVSSSGHLRSRIRLTPKPGRFIKEGSFEDRVFRAMVKKSDTGERRVFVVFNVRSSMEEYPVFEFLGSPEEFIEAYSRSEFRAALLSLVVGKSHTEPKDRKGAFFCKTHYAINHGIKHFLTCHLTCIRILDILIEEGFQVEVRDEGEYWETRDVNVLIREIESQAAMVAAFAGSLKDALEDEGFGVESSAFDDPRFERRECEGQTDQDFAQLVRLIKSTVVSQT